MLKFELSKQLFQEVGEDEETDDIDIGEGGQPDNESSNNKESDKDLFAKLFDYDHQQVETIASGDSQASKTLSRTSLAQLEREITARAAAASPHTNPSLPNDLSEFRESEPIGICKNINSIHDQGRGHLYFEDRRSKRGFPPTLRKTT